MRSDRFAIRAAVTFSGLMLCTAVAPSTRAAEPASPPAPAPATTAAPATAPAMADKPAPALQPAAKGEAPDTIKDVLFGGKVNLDLRLRFEYADFNDTGAPGTGHAETARLRLGYGTKAYEGFSGYVEFEGVWAADHDSYNDGINGITDRALIADPPVTELNQAFGKYDAHGLTFIGGRQRIKLDNDRFVGNVGWRQDEQTYDAISVKYKAPDDIDFLKDFTFYYAYLTKINRIFATDQDWDSDSHLINVSYSGLKCGTLTAFAYLLDFRGFSPSNDGNTFGFRFAGGTDLDKTYKLGYEASYARQVDAGVDGAFAADYYMVGASITHKPTATTVGVGYEVLGSDGGDYGFRTPLATAHAFQGWADAFLTTPNPGVRDLYAYVGSTLPYDIKGKFVGHMFWEDKGGDFYGYELDAVASKAVTDWMTVLTKVAYFEGDAGTAGAPGDRIRFWLQLEIKY